MLNLQKIGNKINIINTKYTIRATKYNKSKKKKNIQYKIINKKIFNFHNLLNYIKPNL